MSTTVIKNIIHWLDAEADLNEPSSGTQDSKRVNCVRCVPFIIVHVCCIGVIWVGWSPLAVAICMAAFWLRMFAITAFYHRYFSHRSYKTNRFWQFCFAVLGATAAQRGPLWWASHHRNHHKHSDKEDDLHSPISHSFWWSHLGWFMSDAAYKTDYSVIPDLAKFPELRWLNRFDSIVPILFGTFMFVLGGWIGHVWPESGVTGGQLLIWGFFISTVLLFHSTFLINSLGHVWGSRRFKTKDHSRNNAFLALLTLGEGWHNNHHRFAVSARQGFYWWEIDIVYYVLKLFSFMGIVRDLNPVPQRILIEGKTGKKPDQSA